MACGLPIITSTKCGVAELIAGADAGFVCASRDASALAAHMRALGDPALRERMGANARRVVLALTPAAMTLQLVLLYKSLLEASVARRRAEKEKARSMAPAADMDSPPPDAPPGDTGGG